MTDLFHLQEQKLYIDSICSNCIIKDIQTKPQYTKIFRILKCNDEYEFDLTVQGMTLVIIYFFGMLNIKDILQSLLSTKKNRYPGLIYKRF